MHKTMPPLPEASRSWIVSKNQAHANDKATRVRASIGPSGWDAVAEGDSIEF